MRSHSRAFLAVLSILVVGGFTGWCRATVMENERLAASRWVQAKFRGQADPPVERRSGLIVLANHDPVQQNARGSKPLRMSGESYTRGLYCHAVSRVRVRLPAPGKSFSAVVGVDSNEQTSGGRGSVVFSVHRAEQEVFRSPVLNEGMASLRVAVDLQGGAEFELNVDDAGDGIACDQSDWADARATLVDGREVWLGDLPLLDAEPAPLDTNPPFSFLYADVPSDRFLAQWPVTRDSRRLDPQRTEHAGTWTDPRTALRVRCVAVEYDDFPTVEWTLHLKNTGSVDSPVISDIQALDTAFQRPDGEEFVLHHHRGSPCTPVDYEPLQTVLASKAAVRIGALNGRPTNSDLPFFNLGWRDGGVIAAVGWPGQWAARFERDEGRSLRMRGGQELTRFTLHPGEEVRSPLIVLQFYEGDRFRSQNVWRAWMREHNLPRPGGRPIGHQSAACSSHQFGEMIHANEENQKFFIDRYLEERIPLDYWWMDAGWYPNDLRYSGAGWPNTGTWEVDRQRFPRGLRAITDHGHARGVRSIVWFEPERVTPGTWLWRNHQDWLLGPKADANQEVTDASGPRDKLLDLGNPQAREWLTDHVDRLLTDEGIDLYRQDFNTDPLDRWRASDPPDRQGITEIRYVEGYLAYWDELRRRHPDLLIDSCASGGRRNDLETMRRAVPLLRSDYILEPVGQQNHTYGIALWYPFYGTGMTREGLYESRSCFCPHLIWCYDMRDRAYPFDRARRVAAEWQRLAPLMLGGDYYPLTPYNPADNVWMAWQFDDPRTGTGVVQAFRRGECIYSAAELRLKGLDGDARYVIEDLDSSAAREYSGKDLMDKGLPVSLPDRPLSAVLFYRRVR